MSLGNTRDTATCAPHIQQTAACAEPYLASGRWSVEHGFVPTSVLGKPSQVLSVLL